MKPRMNFYQTAPDTIKALSALEAQVQASGLEQSLIELVKTRASQINGCAYCIAPDDLYEAVRAVLGSRDRQPRRADRNHQCLEPPRDQFSRSASGEGESGSGVKLQHCSQIAPPDRERASAPRGPRCFVSNGGKLARRTRFELVTFAFGGQNVDRLLAQHICNTPLVSDCFYKAKNGFLNRRSHVRVMPGSPTLMLRGFTAPQMNLLVSI